MKTNHPAARDFDAVLAEALACMIKDEAEQANLLLYEAAALAPASPMPPYLLAAEYAEHGRVADAEAAYLACLDKAPQFALARFQLGLLQATNERAAEACATWQPLLGLSEESGLRCFVEGLMLILEDEPKAAQTRICEGIIRNREYPTLNDDMAKLLARMVRERLGPPATPTRAKEDEEDDGEPSPDDESGPHFLFGGYVRH